MYNSRLDTFIQVADTGSFSKAAEENFITSTAVIKQINGLEAELGLRLFERTHRGLTLTESGKSLYNDAKYIVAYCKDSVGRAKKAGEHTDNIIRVGTSPITPGEFLIKFWPKVQVSCPGMKIQLVPFENTPENAREILRHLGRDIDIVPGIYDESYEENRGCAALKLGDEPICCAVSLNHRLAGKSALTVDDLQEESVMIIRRSWNSHVDELRDFMEKRRVKIIDFDFYDLSVFNRCENGNSVMLAFDGWRNAHPLIKILPVEWDFSVPFGLLHSLDPTDTVKDFLSAVELAFEL